MRDWLVAIRKEKEGKTQTEVARAVGVTQQAYCLIELEENRPSIDTAKAIAAALNFEKYGLDWTKFYEDGR